MTDGVDDTIDLDLSPRSQPEPAGAPKRRRNLVPMLVLGAVLIAGGVIITQFLTSAVDYFCNVDEVGVVDGCDTERRIRLQGTVDAGSVDSTQAGITAFTMSYNDVAIDVEYDGEPGGIFKECIPVVVHGEIRNGVMFADRVEVKHSEEYEAANESNLNEAERYADGECPDTE